MKYLSFLSKRKIILMAILMVLSSFNGILLSGIIVSAGKLSEVSTFDDILKFGMFAILGWSGIYMANYYLEITESSIIKDINIKIKKMYFLDKYFSYENNKDYSSIISVLTNDLKLIEENYFRQIFEIISSVLLFLASLIFMLHLNFWVSIIFISLSAFPIFVPILMKKILSDSANLYSISNADYIHIIKEVFNGFRTLKSYSVNKEIIKLTDDKLEKLEESTFYLKRSELLARLVTVLIAGLCFLIPLVVGCYFVIYYKSLTFAELIGIFLANDKVLGPVQSIAYSLNKINTTSDLRQLFLSYLDISQEDTVEYEEGVFVSDIDELHLKNVVYEITSDNKLDLNFVCKSTFRILVIGASGTGKTTILNLINGLIQPNQGSVTLLSNGKESKNIIPVVEQIPFIFDTTIRNNITLFQNEYFSDDQIIESLKLVNLFDEINVNDKLNYKCGENGSNLSGGQKQKIALARALIRNNKVYLFDEISSNLDNTNSEIIHDKLFNLDISFIEISHHFNLNEPRYTDIYELKDGQLIKLK